MLQFKRLAAMTAAIGALLAGSRAALAEAGIATPWQMGMQDAVTEVMDGAAPLHPTNPACCRKRRAAAAAYGALTSATWRAETPGQSVRTSTAVSTWLNGGVSPTTVAEWAGHSVEILLKIYAKCLDGEGAAVRRRVEAALGY